MDTIKNASVLNSLISILEDGREGYLNASKNTDSEILKSEFLSISRERSLFVVELQDEINRLGKSTDAESGPLGAIHRAWIDFKSMLTGSDNEAIIEACITGEEYAIEKYKEALKDEDLNLALHPMVSKQLASIEKSVAKIKTLEYLK